MANECIKVYAIKKGVKMVQIANEMNIFKSNLSRMLKLELSNEKKLEIIGIIDEISNENAKFEKVSEDEKLLIDLFRSVPDDKKRLAIEMIRAALKAQ